MDSQYDSIGEAGLRFFGKVSASIAHEMKNILAIINENAGLLEDMTFAAQRKGEGIDPERLNRACQNFSKQIHRADEILKNMSQFAHSVDQLDVSVNLHELTGFVSTLAGRLAAMRKVTIETAPPKEPINLTTNTFLLENLIWLCLEFAIKTMNSDQTLILTLAKQGEAIHLQIAPVDGLAEAYPHQLPAGYEEILSALGAELVPDFAKSQLTLHLPARAEA